MKSILLAALCAAIVCSTSAYAQTDTTFTYQGSLLNNGSAADGSFNLDFVLFDALIGGNQIGSEVMFNSHPVVDGLFTVELDFGALAFDNSSRWIEITVNGTELSPRQSITRSPYSIQTRGIFVDENNKVGIGTSTPLADLYIDGSGSTDASLILHDPGASTGDLIFGSPAGSPGIVGVATNGNRRDIRFSDGGIELLTSSTVGSPIAGNGLVIKEDGKVGIGTTSPLTALHVQGILRVEESAELTLIGETSVPSLHFRKSNTGEDWVLKHDANRFHIQTEAIAGTEIMTLDYNGNVGIGTSTPDYPLHVVAAADRVIYAHNTVTIGTAYGVYGVSNSTSGTGVSGVAIASSGINYGVRGTSESTIGYGVFGEASATSGTNHGGRFQSRSTFGTGVLGWATASSGVNYGVIGMSNSSSGFDFYADGAGTNYGAASSRRWKSNIEPIGDPLRKLAQLRGVYYDWDDEHGGQHDLGMIAEEVGEVLPEIVNYEENGIDAIGMDYSKMTPLLVEATNALRAEKDAEVQQLNNDVTRLRLENELLKARLDRLERMMALVVDN